VATDDQLRQSLAAACEQPFVAKAPAVIAVVGLDPAGVMSCGIPRDAVDCSIAASYMTLAATALGLGTCWIGHFDQDACRGLLQVPLTAKIVALLAVGYPDEPSRPKTRKPMNEVVSHQKF
jgi:nitroreductase